MAAPLDFRCTLGLRRRGLTLLEVMLTLAVVVSLAALAWPSLSGPMASHRLRKAGDQVMAEWTKARVYAMKSGLTSVFLYTPGDGRYTIQQCAAAESPPDAPATDGSTTTDGSNPTPPSAGAIERTLPEGVVFLTAVVADDPRALAVPVADPSATDATSGEAAVPGTPIYFYPDGTTSTALLSLKNQYDRAIELNIRGLTGTIRVSDVQSAAELMP